MVLIDSGAMHNFASDTLVQAVQASTINVEPIYITLGNKTKVLSTKLAKLYLIDISHSLLDLHKWSGAIFCLN